MRGFGWTFVGLGLILAAISAKAISDPTSPIGWSNWTADPWSLGLITGAILAAVGAAVLIVNRRVNARTNQHVARILWTLVVGSAGFLMFAPFAGVSVCVETTTGGYCRDQEWSTVLGLTFKCPQSLLPGLIAGTIAAPWRGSSSATFIAAGLRPALPKRRVELLQRIGPTDRDRRTQLLAPLSFESCRGHSLHLCTILGKRSILRRSMRSRPPSRRRSSRGSWRDAKTYRGAPQAGRFGRVAGGRRPLRTRTGPPRREVRREDRALRVRSRTAPLPGLETHRVWWTRSSSSSDRRFRTRRNRIPSGSSSDSSLRTSRACARSSLSMRRRSDRIWR